MNKARKIVSAVIGTAIAVITLTSCGPVLDGSGTPTTISYEHENFTSFSINGAAAVSIRQEGSDYSVSVTIDNNLQDKVDCRVSGSSLVVGLDQGYNYRNVTMSAEITIPAAVQPTAINMSQASRGTVLISNTGNFAVTMSGAAILNIGSDWTSTGSLTFDLEGASRVSISDGLSNSGLVTVKIYDASYLSLGTGSSNGGGLSASLSSAGNLEMGRYEVSDITVSLKDASRGAVKTNNGSLQGSLTGASSLIYYGNPSTNTVSVQGASTIMSGI